MDRTSEEKRKPILDPVDRVTEVIFGLLMAMTFVGALSVATSGREEARTMLIAAFGCNLAWGLADAVMYLLRTWTDRTRNRNLLIRLQQSANAEEGQALVAEALPPRIAAVAGTEGLELLRRRLLESSGEPVHPRLGLDDFIGAIGIFLLVVLATFPVVIPFLLMSEMALAIRTSNLVALGVLFISGWVLARHSGANSWAGGVAMAIVGTALMFAIIALGG